MNPDLRTGVLLLAIFWSLLIVALTVAATGAFFFPPRTFGELLADGFTLFGLLIVLAMLRWAIGSLRHPPDE